MEKIPVYASTGAIITRLNGRNYRLIPEIVPQLHADGVEFMMYDSWSDEVREIRAFLRRTGIYFPVMHLDKKIGEMLSEFGADGLTRAKEMLARDLITAREIGAEKLVLHLWSGAYSDLHFGAMLDAIEPLSEMAQKAGRRLTVENVTCRVARSLPRMRAVYKRCPRVDFTYDTKMAQLHGENEMLPLPEWDWLFAEKHVNHLHVNDTLTENAAKGRMPVLHYGDGEVRFAQFFDYIRQKGFSGTATVESTSCREDGSIDVERFNRSLDGVRSALNCRRSEGV